MHLENRLSAFYVRQVDDNAPVEAAGTKQRLVEYVGLVGRGQHDDPLATRETVHFGKYLVQRLLLLARTANHHLATGATDRIDFVDEDDPRRLFARLLEQITHPRRPHPDDHFHE